MVVHHFGMATENIDKTILFLGGLGEVIPLSGKVFDKNQNAWLQMFSIDGCKIELVEGGGGEELP